jgi:hypothetical protein
MTVLELIPEKSCVCVCVLNILETLSSVILL